MAEQFRFQEVLGDGGAVDADEGLLGPARALVDVAGHHFLADAAFAGDQDRGVRGGDLVGQGHHRLHRGIRRDQRPLVVRHGRQHRGDQVGFGGQGYEFLGAGPDGPGRQLGVGAHAAGHHRHPDALGLVGGDQGRDVELVVDHQEVRALAGAQRLGGPFAGLHVGDLGASGHGHLHRLGDQA